MPIKLSTIEVVKHYLLDDGSLLTVVAEQFNGVKARTFDARMIAPLSVPNSGSIQFHTKSMLYRAGVATALSLKECSLLDPETGKKILTPSPNEIDKFLDVWYHPALSGIALTDNDNDAEYTYCDLVVDAVYEVNPQADPFPDAARPPTSGEE